MFKFSPKKKIPRRQRNHYWKPSVRHKKVSKARRTPRRTFSSMNRSNLFNFIGRIDDDRTLGKKLVYHMLDKKVTVSWLAEETGIEPRRIQDIRNDKKKHTKLNRIIAICIALELTYSESIEMISLAGYALRRDKEEEALYDYFLMHIDSLDEDCTDDVPLVALCNRKLIELGHKPLTELR